MTLTALPEAFKQCIETNPKRRYLPRRRGDEVIRALARDRINTASGDEATRTAMRLVHDLRLTRTHRLLLCVDTYVAALACHQQSADSTVLLRCVLRWRRSPLLNVFSRYLVLSCLKPTSLCNLSSLSNAVVIKPSTE